jgi:hypothetical protein
LGTGQVVGAFKHVYWAVLDQPIFGGETGDVLVVGDDEKAKAEVFAMFERAPFRLLNAGPLINARAIERITMITGALGRSLGTYPRLNWRLLG